jgi:two-component system chemotaxis sensor kinase CheA
MAKESNVTTNDAIDTALNRLLCDLALSGEQGGLDIGNCSSSLVELVVALGSPVLTPLIAEVAVAGTADDLQRALRAFSEAWQAWQTPGQPGSAAGPRRSKSRGGKGRTRKTAARDSNPEPPSPTEGRDSATAVDVGVPAGPAQASASESIPVATPSITASAPPSRSPVDEDVAALQGDPELSAMFAGEALDHLSSIEACVLQLEAAPGDTKLLNDIFRPFHTVKGNAGALGVTRVQECAHKVENLLDLCRSGRHAFGAAEADAVLEAVDVLTALITDLQKRLSGQPGVDLEPRRLHLMDVVNGLVSGDGVPDHRGDAAAARSQVAAAAAATPPQPAACASESEQQAPAPETVFRRRADDVSGQASVKVDTRKLDNLVDMIGELVIAQSILQEDPALQKATDEHLTRNLAQLKRITSDLQKNAMSMRMVPIRQTFQKMARLVRDLSKRSGKQVELVLSGEDTELDRHVVEDINDPLMHMVRNSMDHGIEDAESRVKAGKKVEGRLSLSAYHQAGNIVIAIKDDGAGLNTERILAKAVSQGLVEPNETLSPSDIHQLIFRPGFSTAEKITEISGRGVGMDVVRRNIAALRGRIEIQSIIGQGTTFLIKLPLTLAILDGLVLGVGPQRFVLPTFAVRESLRPVPDQVHSVKGRPCMIQVREKLVPLVQLSELFDIEDAEKDACQAIVVLIEDDGRQVGLVVDRLLGKQEVVIKSLGDAFGQRSGVAGGAILGDGKIGLILDAHGIVGRTRGEDARAA